VAELAAEAHREFSAVDWKEYASLAASAVESSTSHGRLGIVLSERERQVGDLLVQGRTNREIAQHLVISEKTAEKHVAALFKTLDVSNRSQAAATLAKMGAEARG